MKKTLLIIFALVLICGCGKKDSTNPKIDELGTAVFFSQADFKFSAPRGWAYQDKDSKKDTFVYKSADDKILLTISVLYLDRAMKKEEIPPFFRNYVETRRNSELEVKPAPVLSEPLVGIGEGYMYAKYAGIENTNGTSSATLMTIEKGKLFTLYLQKSGTDKDSLTAISNDIFSKFNVK